MSEAESKSSPQLVAPAALGILAIFLIRLPQMRSANLFVEGDEAVVGMMAKHAVEGLRMPGFFYGQIYGLSTFEAANVKTPPRGRSGLALEPAAKLSTKSAETNAR